MVRDDAWCLFTYLLSLSIMIDCPILYSLFRFLMIGQNINTSIINDCLGISKKKSSSNIVHHHQSIKDRYTRSSRQKSIGFIIQAPIQCLVWYICRAASPHHSGRSGRYRIQRILRRDECSTPVRHAWAMNAWVQGLQLGARFGLFDD